MIYFAVMGHGIVGSGVAEVFFKNKKNINERAGSEMDIKYILDIRDFPDLAYHDCFIKDFSIIEKDPEVTVVVETIGGTKPAYDYVRRCLLAGKSVVTSNKELIATHGAELLQIAQDMGVMLLFEASVGGGIPIIRPLHQCLAANNIKSITGILNGTTNFILTKMVKENMSFEDALKIAQDLGYAERNPAADIEGHDTVRKICILASLAFGKHVYPHMVETCGITGVTKADIAYAESWGGVIKLLGFAERIDEEEILAWVSPAFVPVGHQLAGIEDVFNGIIVSGDATGDVMFYGRGAGKLPTASAVIADVIDCVHHKDNIRRILWEDACQGYVRAAHKVNMTYYFRYQEPVRSEAIDSMLGSVRQLQLKNDRGYAAVVVNISKDSLLEKLAPIGIPDTIMPVMSADD